MLSLAATAAIVVLLRMRIAVGRSEVALVVALAAFTAWTALSAAWADDPSQAMLEAERALVYVAGVAAAVLLVERANVPYLLVGVAAAAVMIASFSIAAGARPGESLTGPIGYANALGMLAVTGILIAVGGALQARRALMGAFAVAAAIPLALTLVLSNSRGSVVALAVGLIATVALVPLRLRLLLGATIVAATVAAIAAAVWSGHSELSAGDRRHYWRVAWAQFEEKPVLGAGAGGFHDYWLGHRPDPAELDTPEVLDAHSLYLETLAELGSIGLVLVVTALAIPLVVGLRRRGDRVAAAAVPAYIAFVVHAGLDWDWEMPAVTLAGLFCGVAILRARADGRANPLTAPIRGFVLALALGLILLALSRLA